ncbi:MAG: hypothetical protein M1835_005835 [Candelina submexicana]|nr:MAG: hypothetical protein M1835_005835 [Candelina submexicana]
MPFPHEVIDLSSDSPQTSPKPAQSKKLLTRHGEVLFHSDDFDSTINLDDSWTDTPAKRPRLSPSPFEDEALGRPVERIISTQCQEEAAIGRPTTSRGMSSRSEEAIDHSDPIIITSSPHHARNGTRKTTSIPGGLSPLSDEPSETESFEDLGPVLRKTPRANAHFSSKTAALLANLSKGNAALDLDRNSSTAHSKYSESTKVAKSGLVRSKSKLKQNAGNEGLAVSVKAPKKPPKGKLNGAEKDAKALEHEHNKALDKVRKAKEKEDEKEKKQKLKDEKAREKRRAAELAEVNKSKLDKKDSTPEMIVDLPSSLDETGVGSQIKAFLDNLQVQYTTFESPLPNVVKWRRKVCAKYSDEMGIWEPVPMGITNEKHALCLLSAKEFVDMAQVDPTTVDGQELSAHVLKFKNRFEGCAPIYLIEGLSAWMRKNKNVRNRAYQAAVLSQMDGEGDNPTTLGQPKRPRRKKLAQEYVDEDMIEDALLQLQVMHKCLIHHTAAPVESAEWVANFTQHISTIPYKAERMNLDTSFCMDVGQVKTGDDKDDTYVRMLQEIVRVTAPVAYGIASEYPNVLALVKGFREKGPTALEDLMVRSKKPIYPLLIHYPDIHANAVDPFKKSANRNGAFTNNRIGKAISKRIYNIFMCIDPGSNYSAYIAQVRLKLVFPPYQIQHPHSIAYGDSANYPTLFKMFPTDFMPYGWLHPITELGDDTPVYEDRGTPYAVTQKEIDEIQDPNRFPRWTGRCISQRRATQRLVDAHAHGVHLDHDQLAAMDRLQGLGNLNRWGSDIAIKAFNDLDKIFFMGTLRGNVYLRWSDKFNTTAGRWLGVTHPPSDELPRIMIQLSTTTLKSRVCSLRDVWATLIHEMIHAYFRLMVAPQNLYDEDPRTPPGHGPCFQACLNALQSRIGNPKYIKLEVCHEGAPRPKAGGYRRINEGEGHRGHDHFGGRDHHRRRRY